MLKEHRFSIFLIIFAIVCFSGAAYIEVIKPPSDDVELVKLEIEFKQLQIEKLKQDLAVNGE